MNDTTNNPNSSLSDNSISQGQPAMPDATNNPDSLPYDNSNLKGQPSMSNITNDNSSLSDASNLQEQSAMSSTIDNSALSKTPQNSRSIHFCAMYTPLLSDFTNASRFAKQYSHRVRYVRDWGWFLFDGTRWHLDDSNHIFTLASASLQSYYDEAASLPKNSPPRLWERLLKHAERSQSLSRLKALLRIACTLPDLCVPHTLFDADPALLTVLNGTINLFTSELLPHNPDHFITRLIPFNYDPQAHSPVWDDFLNRLTDSTLPLQQFLQRALGYSLTGVTDHHLAFLLTGPGHHAHQLFLSLFRDLLGDYASHAPSLNHRALTPNHLTARFLTAPLSASITAHDCSTLSALIRTDPFPLHPSQPDTSIYHSHSKLWLSSSEDLDIPSDHSSLRDRLTLIPIPLTLSHQDIHRLTPLLQEALPAILAWAIQGAMLWLIQGLSEPDQVTSANASFRHLEDDLSPFLESACTLDPARFIRANELYQAYHLWSRAHHYRYLTPTAFGRLLQARLTFYRTRTSLGRFYHGLSLTLSLDQLAAQLKPFLSSSSPPSTIPSP